MEVRLGGFVFFSTFDSGNLGGIRRLGSDDDGGGHVPPPSPASTPAKAKKARRRRKAKSIASVADLKANEEAEDVAADADSAGPSVASLVPADLELEAWTKPDCQGTEFENGNRTW